MFKSEIIDMAKTMAKTQSADEVIDWIFEQLDDFHAICPECKSMFPYVLSDDTIACRECGYNADKLRPLENGD